MDEKNITSILDDLLSGKSLVPGESYEFYGRKITGPSITPLFDSIIAKKIFCGDDRI